MTFTDLQKGEAVFVGANTLVYHFTNQSQFGTACTALVERIELKVIEGFTYLFALFGRCGASHHDD